MTDFDSELTSRTSHCLWLLHSTLNELASATILSTQCDISLLSSRVCYFGNETLHWFHIDGVLTLPPQPTEFHKKYGIPSGQSLLDYVVISGFKDSVFAVTVQHRSSTPELREFFDRIEAENP